MPRRVNWNDALSGSLLAVAVSLLMASCGTINAAIGAAMAKPANANGAQASAQSSGTSAAQTQAPAASQPTASPAPAQSAMAGPGGSAVAYQYQFNAFYDGMWSMGWFGYADSNYKPGQGTVWDFAGAGSGASKSVEYERALLKVNADNSGWWRFKLNNGKTDVLYEFLVGPDGAAQRVRFKDPDTGAVSEFVPDRSGGQPAQAATPASRADMAQYLTGKQQVQVKGGNFNADHYLYSDATRGGKAEYWLSDAVPGYMVKSIYTAKDGKVSTIELARIETGMATELSSY